MAEVAPLGLIGNLNIDLVLGPVSALPCWDQEVLADHAEVRCAGTVGYIALAASALGIPAVVLSTIGQDLYGTYLLEELKQHGISPVGIGVVPEEPTSITVVTVGTGGPRALTTVQGAHKRLDLDYYRRHRRLLDPCAEVFLCGNYLLPNLDCRAALTMARDLRAQGKLVYFDPSWDPTNWSDSVKEATMALLSAVDVFLPNSDELCGLTGLSDWREAASRVAALGPEVVVKRGSAGSAVLAGGEWFEASPFPVECQDTTGAGDVFDAAYLWARRQEHSPGERLRFANAVAALVVKQERRTHYPSLEEATQFLRSVESGEPSCR